MSPYGSDTAFAPIQTTLTRYTHGPVERRIATVTVSVFHEVLIDGGRGGVGGRVGCKNYMTLSDEIEL